MSDTRLPAFLEARIGGELRRFLIDQEHACRIGRSDKNEVVLDDDLASRSHAMLQKSGNGYIYITDLGSSNGTLVNNARVSAPVILRNGDRVRIGNHEFVFHQEMVADPLTKEFDALESTNIFLAQQLITVMVADIRDFTGWGQRVDAATLSKMTGKLYREAGKMLQGRGAWAQKYIGDAIMAVWVHKRQAPDLEEFIAVFDALARLTDLVAGLQDYFDLDAPVRCGVGINSGWASVGNVGSIAASDYTALGDVVTKAFRLESATKEISCDLAMGQDAYDFLNRFVDASTIFEPRIVRLKGYDEPATAFVTRLPSLPVVLQTLNRSLDTGSSVR